MKNSLGKNLSNYDSQSSGPNGKSEKLKKFFQYCKVSINKKDFDKLPKGSARSVNEFAVSHKMRFVIYETRSFFKIINSTQYL